MDRSDRRTARLIAVCLFGGVCFNYPVLAIFDRPATVFGIPLLYAWLFFAWAATIALLAWAVGSER